MTSEYLARPGTMWFHTQARRVKEAIRIQVQITPQASGRVQDESLRQSPTCPYGRGA